LFEQAMVAQKGTRSLASAAAFTSPAQAVYGAAEAAQQ
jgi:hypothetical protein